MHSSTSSLSDQSASMPLQLGLNLPPSVIRQAPPSAHSSRPFGRGVSTPQSAPQLQRSLSHNSRYQCNSRAALVLDAGTASSTPRATGESRQSRTTFSFLSEQPTIIVNNRSNPERPAHNDDESTAAAMAQSAPYAGFLQKLGANIPEFKRRFFVLQPGTHLYYFLSPGDTTPRGCLDLEDSWIEEVGELSDGRYRFAIAWKQQKVLLEARTKEIAKHWIKSLEEERLPFVKSALEKAKRKNAAYQRQIAELRKEIQDFKLIEKDRDGALEDAAHWKAQFENLDDAIRRLTRYIRKEPRIEAKNDTNSVEEQKSEETVGTNNTTSKGTSTESKGEMQEMPLDNTEDSRETSLLDEALEKEKEIDVLNVPGRHYGALYNACEQIRENLRLASIEAAGAVEDLTAANERVAATEHRMGKAEKHLCKLWEENCSIRKTLKQKKREKRVLVREVKNLREAAKARNGDDNAYRGMVSGDDASSSVMNGSEEDKLLEELEEHVTSSIKLHEQILSANGASIANLPHRVDFDTSTEVDTPVRVGATVRIAAKPNRLVRPQDQPPPKASLLDDSADESESDVEPSLRDDTRSVASSLQAEASDTEHHGIVDVGIVTTNTRDSQTSREEDSPERRNPLEELDDTEENEAPPLCTASSQSESSKSVVTTNGLATSKLSCPLSDVVSIGDHSRDMTASKDDGVRVYHLTFYSRKIGLQFQKVPPPPRAAKGLLTEALTADLDSRPSGMGATTAELRRIVSISSSAKSSELPEQYCDVATPDDAVIVCGFVGFDESGSNKRPRLGARLVAFDGVSVEVGKWTFDSIRKAIQGRSRPLTLSFRNDFLTTEQRAILTKAANDVAKAAPPPQRTVQYQPGQRPPSTDPSVQSALSHETDRFVNEVTASHESDHFVNDVGTRRFQHDNDDDDLSVSASGSDYPMPYSFSAGRSVSSGRSNFRSFSEAGSSVSVLSAVAPLVSNLLGSARKEPFTPEYMRREAESIESTPQHQDFKSELL